jgi:uncharacterized protein YukE
MPLLYYVDMPTVRTAIAKIKLERDTMEVNLTAIDTGLTNAAALWSGPAASTFAGLNDQLVAANKALLDATDAIVSRMESTANNYHATETANYYTVGGA